MRSWLMVWVAAGMALRAFGAHPVTVAQLEQALVSSQSESDAQIASQLSGMQLTERLNSSELARLIVGLHGKKSTEALTVLGDMSAFLNPPPAEVPAEPAPDMARQREMMAKVVDDAVKMNHRLPNFFATRTTARFEDWPKELKTRDEAPARYIPPQVVDESSASSGIATQGRSKRADEPTQKAGIAGAGALFLRAVRSDSLDCARGREPRHFSVESLESGCAEGSGCLSLFRADGKIEL
jgi:hypothetical protein